MSETLVLAFQTQLSGVMETVLKTAMYEITRLVEDGFLEEVRRGHQEVESLRTLLQLSENQLKDGGRRARCADCGRTAVLNEGTSDRPPATQNNALPLLTMCDLKLEEDPEVRWRSCGQATAESPPEVPEPPSPPAPGPPSVDGVKKEEEATAEPWRTKESAQPFAARVYAEERRDSLALGPTSGDDVEFSPVHPEATAVTQTHRSAGSSPNQTVDCDRPTRSSPVWIDRRMLDADVDVHRSAQSNLPVVTDPPSSSEPLEAKQQTREVVYQAVKEEIIVDSDVGEDEEEVKEDGVRSVVGRYRIRPDNYNAQRSLGQGVMKLPGSYTEVDAGLVPQQPHQTVRKHPHVPPANLGSSAGTSVSAPSSSAGCHVFNNLNYRIPSKYKPSPQSLPRMRVYRDAAKRGGYITYNRGPAHGGLNPAPSQSVTQQQGIHQQQHHPVRLALRCPVCGKVFPHPSNLKAHQQTHTGERPFVCALCGRSFTKLSNLKAHRRVHTGERPYSCSDCGKRFTQKCNLKRHQRIHMENDI